MGVLKIFSMVFYSVVLVLGAITAVMACASRKRDRLGDEMCRLTLFLAGFCGMLLCGLYIFGGRVLSGMYVVHLSFAMSPLFLRRLFGDRNGLVIMPLMSALVLVAVILSFLDSVRWSLDRWIPPLMGAMLLLLIGGILWERLEWTGKFDAAESSKEWTDSLADIFYFVSLALIAVVGSVMGDGGSWNTAASAVVCVVFLIGLLIALWRRMRSGKAFLLFVSREGTYIENISRSSKAGGTIDVECGLSGEALFKSLKEYFDKKMPYLDPKVCMNDVAKSLLTNTAYLSRAINDFTGQNFHQFVNLYRVRYAVKLFNGNNAYKVTDLAVKSGFNSERSFTMAFRLYMNISPSRWCKENRGKHTVKVLRN